MKNKYKIGILIVVLFFGILYYFLFYKNTELQYIPKNADAAVVIDVKNIQNQYLTQFLTHPSEWKFKSSDKDDDRISILKSGIEIPYFVQIFHVKDTSFSTWFTVFELNDSDKFIQYLTQEKFHLIGENIYQKDKITIKITAENCLIAYNSKIDELQKLAKDFSTKNSFKKDIKSSNYLESNAVASVVLFENNVKPIQVYFERNHIEIKNSHTNLINEIAKPNAHFFSINFNRDLLQKAKTFYAKTSDLKFIDSLQIKNIQAEILDIKQVKDSIITYDYDDDFNEIKKVSFQKILQPEYKLQFSAGNNKNLFDYFIKNGWINNKNQFVKIPFQPNFTTVSSNTILISTQKNAKENTRNSTINYLVFTNSKPFLWNEIHFLSKDNKKKIALLESIQFINKNDEYVLKIQFKKEKLPWILEL